MDIVKENIDDLNAVLRVRIAFADYSQRYSAALKKYQKKVDLPGFRPGKVPVEVVKKRFGKHIMAEEINEILSETLHKYISENNIEILGSPLPKENGHIDFDNQTEFEFQYELGLTPKLEIELSSKDTYPYYVIKIDDLLVDKQIEQLRMNYGQVIYPEISEEKDVLTADLAEVDMEGNIMPGGVLKTTRISPKNILNTENKNKLIGLKTEDKIILENLPDDTSYFCKLIGLTEDKLKNIRLQCRVRKILRIVPAELNQELFDKIYGSGIVNSEEELKNKVRDELSGMLAGDSDVRFMRDVKDSVLKKSNVHLPENFLKKYILAMNKESREPGTSQQIDAEFSSYTETLKWQLIENYILKKYKLSVTEEELKQFVTYIVKMQFVKHGYHNPSEEELKAGVKKVLDDEKQVRNTYDRLYEHKIKDIFKNTFTIEKKEVTYEDFYRNL